MCGRRELHPRAIPLLVLYHPAITESAAKRGGEASMGERLNGVLKRRGLLAGAVALAGAGLAKLTGPGHAEAAHTTPEDVLHADVVNTTTGQTEIHYTGVGLRALHVRSTNASYAFQATADNGGNGAVAVSTGPNGIGVVGEGGDGLSFGVLGLTGGATANASGVRGLASSGATNGVWGENRSSADNCDGVFGLASAATGATVGVWGRSTSSTAGASPKTPSQSSALLEFRPQTPLVAPVKATPRTPLALAVAPAV